MNSVIIDGRVSDWRCGVPAGGAPVSVIEFKLAGDAKVRLL